MDASLTERTPSAEDDLPCCPNCKATALNRYGRIASGKQRYLCLVCGRQFVESPGRRELPVPRPECPVCGRSMHTYIRAAGFIRFRCSCYPECKTYLRIPLEEEN